MGKVTAVMMDTITEKSGHTIVPNAVSVCLTPAAPSPLPIPYPVFGAAANGVTDPPMRTKINGAKIATTGSVIKSCNGNEPGTLKEVVSLNTGGPCFIIVGAPVVICELGMMGITGSMCISNKAPTFGAGATTSNAGGAGGSGGSGGGGGGGDSSGDPNDSANAGGAGGGGSSTGAVANPPSAGPRYCPPAGHKAPPHMEAGIDAQDLRLRQGPIADKGNKWGRAAAHHAMFGQPGGAKGGKGQAFWSGSGKDNAKRDGFTIQEDGGGAGALDKRGKANMLPDWSDDAKAGSGSGVTNEALWKTISRRSAENSKGTVDAFVVGTARDGNVFAAVELPTLLHNPNVDQINFRDPDHKPPPAPINQSWKRNKTDGCWEGDPVPSGTAAAAANGRPPPKFNNPGFSLHPTQGFVREPK